MTPRLRPYLLVAGTLLPLIVFGLLGARQLLRHESAAIEREAIGRARAAMSAVDAHLRNQVLALETLGASKSLEAGDIRAFHAESQRVLRTQHAWVNIGLASNNRMQLFNAVYAFGRPEPFATDDPAYSAAVRGARATFSNVATGTAVQSPTVRVRVPVSYADEVRYVISAPLNLRQLAELMQVQVLPEDWGISLVDREARVIVRIPAVPAGAEEAESFRAAVRRAPEGWFEGHNREGKPTHTAYVTSQLTGWVVGVALPSPVVDVGKQRIVTMLVAGMLLSLGMGMALAWQLSGSPR